MPVMVLYKDKDIPLAVVKVVIKEIALVTHELLDAKIEVRVVEPVYRFNANEIHIEMRFRDFGEWSNAKLEAYHSAVMEQGVKVLREHKVLCAYSFYIIPTTPPRSLWAQVKIGI
jgi:hypothetical protein